MCVSLCVCATTLCEHCETSQRRGNLRCARCPSPLTPAFPPAPRKSLPCTHTRAPTPCQPVCGLGRAHGRGNGFQPRPDAQQKRRPAPVCSWTRLAGAAGGGGWRVASVRCRCARVACAPTGGAAPPPNARASPRAPAQPPRHQACKWWSLQRRAPSWASCRGRRCCGLPGSCARSTLAWSRRSCR